MRMCTVLRVSGPQAWVLGLLSSRGQLRDLLQFISPFQPQFSQQQDNRIDLYRVSNTAKLYSLWFYKLLYTTVTLIQTF